MEAQDYSTTYDYSNTTGDLGGYDPNAVGAVPVDPYAGLNDEQKAALEEEFRAELAKTEEEIQTLKQVLASKTKHAQELKRKLGISAWAEWANDLGQGVQNLKETTAYREVNTKMKELNTKIHSAPIYQKTSEALGGVTEKASGLFGGLGGGLMRKVGGLKDSSAFKSFEATVGSTVGVVKSKMSGSRSNSTNSFEEALNSMEAQRQQQTGATGTNSTNSSGIGASIPATIPESNGN